MNNFAGVDLRKRSRIRSRFINKYGLKESQGTVCIDRLNGKMCCSAMNRHLHRFEGADHTSLWNKDGKPVCYVSQPYKEAFERPEHQAALANIEELGYFVRVDFSGSWHYPGKTVLIEIWKDKETFERCLEGAEK